MLGCASRRVGRSMCACALVARLDSEGRGSNLGDASSKEALRASRVAPQPGPRSGVPDRTSGVSESFAKVAFHVHLVRDLRSTLPVLSGGAGASAGCMSCSSGCVLSRWCPGGCPGMIHRCPGHGPAGVPVVALRPRCCRDLCPDGVSAGVPQVASLVPQLVWPSGQHPMVPPYPTC